MDKKLHYYDIYNISNGVFLTFQKNLKERLLYVSHSKEIMDKKMGFYPLNFTDRNDFILLCVYIMFKYSPSSIYGLCEYLKTYNTIEYDKFKNTIKFYKNLIKKDVTLLEEKYKNPMFKQVMYEYNKKQISFVTLYWYLILYDIKEFNGINNTIVCESILNVFKFLTFKDESKDYIKNIFKQIEGDCIWH